jgi:hypothetical protein
MFKFIFLGKEQILGPLQAGSSTSQVVAPNLSNSPRIPDYTIPMEDNLIEDPSLVYPSHNNDLDSSSSDEIGSKEPSANYSDSDSDDSDSLSERDATDTEDEENNTSELLEEPSSLSRSQSMFDFAGISASIPPELLLLREQLKNNYKPPPEPKAPVHSVRKLTDSEKLSLQHYLIWKKSNGTVNAYHYHGKLLESVTGTTILSLHMARKLAGELTQYKPTKINMCPQSCIAFTGQYKNYIYCPYKNSKGVVCNQPHYRVYPNGKQKLRAQATVLPVMATIRAMFANVEMADLLRYRDRLLKEALHLIGTTKECAKNMKYSDFGNSAVHTIHYRNMHLFNDA